MLIFVVSAFALDATGTGRSPVDAGGLQRVTGIAADHAGQLDAGLLGGWASTTAEAHYTDGSSAPLMADLVSAQIGVGWTFFDGLRLEAGVPLLIAASAPVEMPAGVGDMWVDAQWAAVRSKALSFGPLVEVVIPSGDGARLQGSGGLGVGLLAGAGGTVGRVRWAAELGGGTQGVGPAGTLGAQRGADLRFGGGARVALVGPLSVGAEVDGSVSLVPLEYDPEADVLASGAEGLVSAGLDLGRLDLSLYTGFGLADAIGVPDVRVGFAIRSRILIGEAKLADADSDGVADTKDACVSVREDDDGFEDDDGCPDLDDDADGIPDAQDACANDPEDRDFVRDTDGCPDLDDDEDGLPDAVDRCPRVAGPAESSGCPDRDRDGMLDTSDACPDDPAIAGTDLMHNDGCPGRVVVFPDRLRLVETIRFDSGRATIRPESLALVSEIAAVLLRYPNLPHVEIAAHVDAGGDPTLKLTRARAEAVKVALVKAGVPADRLIPAGYGEVRPLAPNDTEPNRELNRRVELVFVR